MREIKISIVVPTYNVEKYIVEFLESVEKLTIGLENLEVIIVNDGSTDRTAEILDQYKSRHDFFDVITLEEASGAAGLPRNVGLERAQGKYITFMDPDDVFTSDGLEKLYSTAQKYDSDVVMGTFELFNNAGCWEHDMFKYTLTEEKFNFKIEQYPDILRAPNNMTLKIYKMEFLKKHQLSFPEGVAAQDAVFTAQGFFYSNSISYVKDKVFKYRVRDDVNNPSITQNRNLKYFQDFIYIRKLLMDAYKKYGKVDYVQRTFTRDLNWMLYQMEYTHQISTSEKIEIINTVSSFVQLAKDVSLLGFPKNRVQLVEYIVNNDIDNALRMMGNVETEMVVRM
ncbi:glycosyltransferase family 2 protein [Bacillus wiedmannii]|uniref:glycosyltransferase family 2 protein n=1 Tax=Bacillus wiedmannii TaxID=1890302 RepID=UPI003D96EA4D